MEWGNYTAAGVLEDKGLRHVGVMPRISTTKGMPNGLRRARLAANGGRGFTLEQAEEATGIPWRNIQRYETGKMGTPIHMLPTFAKAYRVRPHELVDPEPSMRADETELLRVYNRLAPHARRQALTILLTLATDS